MQLCIENIDQAGGCFYGYSCAYTDSISWASPTEPLPMIRDPRAVFDQLFGVGATPEARAQRRRKDSSMLDWVMASVDDMKRNVGAGDRARLNDYLDDVREIERRIQKVEAHNSQRRAARAAVGAGRRARLLRRARQADVRPAGRSRLPGRHHARASR